MSIKAVNLTTSLGTIQDISNMVESFQLNEALLLPVTYGECDILDGINLIDRLGIRGFDYISFVISNVGEEDLVTKNFRIYDVRNRARTSNSSQAYKLVFCSEELFLASEYFVVKTYSNKKVSDIVENIALKYLRIPEDRISIENTFGQINFSCPYMRPLEAIQKVSRHALTKSDHPSFVFYETLKDGFRYRSIETLFNSSAAIPEYYYTQAKLEESIIEKTRIIAYEAKKNFDSLLNTQTGKFASSLLTFDPITLSIKEIKFDLEKWFEKYGGIEGKNSNYSSKMPLKKNRAGDTANQTKESHSRFVVTSLEQSKSSYVKGKSPGILPLQIEKTDLQRNSFFQNFADNRIKLLVPGNTSLQCGNLIFLRIRSPEIQGSTQTDEGTLGLYIITTVTHSLSRDGKFYTQLTVIKDDVMYTATPSPTGFFGE